MSVCHKVSLFCSSSPMIITENITRQKEVERRMNTEECKVYISHQNTSSDQQKTDDLNPSARICFRLNILTKSTSRVYLCASDTALFAPVWPPVSKSLSVFLPSLSLQVFAIKSLVKFGLVMTSLWIKKAT